MYWIHDINPEILHIYGPFALRWYPLAYIAGLAVAYWGFMRLSKKGYLNMTRKEVDDLWFFLGLGVLAGGRIGYILFYDFSAYIKAPVSIFKVWQGGMSFHGGFIGVMIATFIFSRMRKIRLSDILGAEALLAPAGLFFGRIANFVNGELWGRPTDGSWGVIFPEAGPLPRHPTQLYEACLEGVALFLILFFIFKKTGKLKYMGPVFGVTYGIFRIIIEFFRIPDPQLGYLLWGFLTMGQVLSLVMIIFSLFVFVKIKGGDYE